MYQSQIDSYSRFMDTNGVRYGEFGETQPPQTLTQKAWDAANVRALSRQGRARTLIVEHRDNYIVQLPTPGQPRTVIEDAVVDDVVDEDFQDADPARPETVKATGRFAHANEVRERVEASKFLSSQLTLPPEPLWSSEAEMTIAAAPTSKPPSSSCWDEPVDWSECVESPSSSGDTVITLNDLREREIDLRGGQVLLDGQPRPKSIARLRLAYSNDHHQTV